MRALRSGVFALVAGLALAAAQPVGAASPTAVLENFFEGANAILKTVDPFGDLEQPRQAIRTLVNEVFDFRSAAALALGSAWLARTPEEQDEFVKLFAVFLERGFIGTIGAQASVSNGVKIQYVDEAIGEGWAGVATSLLTRSGQALSVDYWFVRSGDRWKVRDVVIDGVSLIANYRSQFNRVLAAYPYSEVLARLGGSQLDAPAMVAPRLAAPAPQVTASAPRVAAPAPQVTAPAPRAAAVTPQIVAPTPQIIASAPQVAAPAPQVAAVTPQIVAPTPQIIAPAPQVTAPAPPVAAPAPQVTATVLPPPTPPRPAPAPQPIPLTLPIPAVLQWIVNVIAPPPTEPAAPVVRPNPRSASVTASPPPVLAVLSPKTFQEIQLTSLSSEASSTERGRAPAAPQGSYWVQLGVFQSPDAASHLAERFRRDGATISKSSITNAAGNRVGVWSRVRVGPFASRSEAASKLQDLSARGQVGFIAEARD